MDLRRPRLGEWMAGGAGALLLASLFLPWYRQGATCIAVAGFPCPNRPLSGWEAFTGIDVELAVAAAGGLALLALAVTQRTPALPLTMAVLTTLAGLVAVLLVALRSVVLPELEPPVPLQRGPGLVTGLLAALGITSGGILSMRDEGFGLRGAGDARPRPATEEDLARVPKLSAPRGSRPGHPPP